MTSPDSTRAATLDSAAAHLTRREARSPSTANDADASHAGELLETLDDAMFAAMAGDEPALARARQLWQDAVAALPWQLVDESREQYLRYAAEVARRFDAAELCNPAAVVAALEVIEMLCTVSKAG